MSCGTKAWQQQSYEEYLSNCNAEFHHKPQSDEQWAIYQKFIDSGKFKPVVKNYVNLT